MTFLRAIPASITVILLSVSAAAATSYTYDALGRISTVTYDNGKQITYSYDPAGNRSQVATQVGTNQPPVAVPDSASTNSNTPAVIHVLTNDTDPDGDTLTIQSVNTADGTNGTAAITGSGTTVTFTPKPNFSGTDSFGYTISDGHGHIAYAPVTVTVVNQPPVANPFTASGMFLHTSNTIDALAHASDPESGPLTLIAVTTPGHGSTAITPDQKVTYTPTGGNTTSDAFNYTVRDDHNQTAQATVTVTFDSSQHNSPPVAVNDLFDIEITGVPVTNPSGAFDPRVNDSDPDGDPLTITDIVTQPTHGTAGVINGGTQVNYVYSGTINVPTVVHDSFTYKISDGNGGTATATINVTLDVQSGQ